MFKNGNREKIIVAMSGGVDSSTTAALLVKKGYQVEGVYMRLVNSKQLIVNNAEKYARAVAEKLNIPFRVMDLRKEFKKRVVNYFLKEFAAGRTPNPCVVCNQQIKFGLLLDKAMDPPVGEGTDYVATGHYARLWREIRNPKPEIRNKSKIQNQKSPKTCKLLTARDKTKDQSYFLYNLTQEKLAKILFPLGEYKKSEVYKVAERWRLPYKRGESVDICFIGRGGHHDFLQKHLGTKPGKIIDASGKVLGKHQGLWFYTIGQRADIGGPGPFYVVELDVKNNAVVVSNKFRDEALYKKSLVAEKVNWIVGVAPKMPLRCKARIRYGHAAVPAEVRSMKSEVKSRKYEVEFKNPQRAITPGQSVVFYSEQDVRYIGRAARYKRNEVLGGGVIR